MNRHQKFIIYCYDSAMHNMYYEEDVQNLSSLDALLKKTQLIM